jgi:lipopolysaccharide heptosyltransferase I
MKSLPVPEKVRRILVVKPSSLGDILHTFPAVELLRRKYPAAKLDWLVHPAFADVLKFSPFPVARAILFERRKLGRLATMPGEFIRLAGAIRRRRYDLVIDFQGLFRSALFGSLARGARQTGFASPRERTAKWFYRHRLPVDMNIHAVERNVALVNQLLGADDPTPELKLPRHLFQPPLPPDIAGRPLIGLVPGARWPSKQFPEQLFAEIFTRLGELIPDGRGVIIGSSADADGAAKIIAATGNDPRLFSLAGKTCIGEMIETIARCELLISNDSGPIHVAAALGIPVLALFGPTDPALTGPYGARNRIFRRTELACLACLKRVCPEGGSPRCHDLNAGEIAEAAAAILRQR